MASPTSTESSQHWDETKHDLKTRPSFATNASLDIPSLALESAKDSVPTVGFFDLWRYATRLEIILNIVGLVSALAAGVSRPFSSLIFAHLTSVFVTFVISAKYAPTPEALEVLQQHFKHEVARYACYMVALGLGMYLATWVYMYIWVYTGEVNSKRIRERYLKAVLSQDVTFFDQLGAGEVAIRLQTSTHMVQQGISEKVPVILKYIATFLSSYGICYFKSWRLALPLTCIVPAIMGSGILMQKFAVSYKHLSMQAIADGGTVAEEVLSTVRTAHAFGTQERMASNFDDHAKVAHFNEYKNGIVQGLGLGFLYFLSLAPYALAFQYGTTLYTRGEATPASILSVILCIISGSFAIIHIANPMECIAASRPAAASLFAVIDRVPPIDCGSSSGLSPHKDSVNGRITFENVSFHYSSRPDVPILDGLTMEFRPRETTALVGASGSGKSTIVSLIERFYDPVGGNIKLDGVDITQLNLRWLRQQIGYVQQEPFLFDTTITENVGYGLIGTRWEHSTQEAKLSLIQEACILANADTFIKKLPNGYDTVVGERGFLLSGGQKQRIAIARAIVSDPKILLLDEATSALDTQSESIVQNALDKATVGRTTIVIAHRLSTIRDAHQIFVFGAGGIIEHGTHNELLRRQGAYAQLVHAQKLKGNRDSVDMFDARMTMYSMGLVDKDDLFTPTLDTDLQKERVFNWASDGMADLGAVPREEARKSWIAWGALAPMEDRRIEEQKQQAEKAWLTSGMSNLQVPQRESRRSWISSRLSSIDIPRVEVRLSRPASARASLEEPAQEEEKEPARPSWVVPGMSHLGVPVVESGMRRFSNRLSNIDIPRVEVHVSRPTSVVSALESPPEQKDMTPKEFSSWYVLKWMLRLNHGQRTIYLAATLSSFACGVVNPGFGLIFAETVAAFTSDTHHDLVVANNRNALIITLIAFGFWLSKFLQSYFFLSTAASLTQKLRSSTFRAMLHQDIGWFDENANSTGGLVSQLSDSPTQISSFLGTALGTLLQSLATIVTGAIIGLCYGPRVAGVAIACLPLVIANGYVELRIVKLRGLAQQAAHERSAQLACEAAGAVRTVQSLTAEERLSEGYAESLAQSKAQVTRTAFLDGGIYGLSQALSFFVIALVFWYGSLQVASQDYGIMDFYVCVMSITWSYIEAGSFFTYLPDFSAAYSAAIDLINLIERVPKVDARSSDGIKVSIGESRRKEPRGRIVFDNVSFCYPTRPTAQVLRRLNLSVEPGTYVALVGESGCGKSTTVQMIERFYDPTSGKITMDGVNIADLNVQDYRKHLALVSQEPTLYAGTIKFNILLGAVDTDVTHAELEQACRDANILEFIQSLPMGFETHVGGKGSHLSGGQKQRIAIARALLRNPKVLLLDEATSALDSQSEKAVQAALDNAARGRTTIAIAHRLSTIQRADKIYFFKDGRVAEAGTHEELVRLQGGYYNLVQMQALTKA